MLKQNESYMSKILILANHPTTIYYFRRELIKRLLSDGHSVILACPHSNKIERIKPMGIKYIEINISRNSINPIHDLQVLFKYLTLVRKIRPDIVFTYTIKPNLYGNFVCRLLHIPCICNVTGLGAAIYNGGPLRFLILLLYKIFFIRVYRIFVQNEEIKNFLTTNKIVSESKIKLIPGSGVNLERFALKPYPNQDKSIEIGYVSRIKRLKGIEQFLEAAIYLKKKHNNINFHVAGFCEENYEPRLKELESSGIITYHGIIENIEDLYEKLSLVVVPTQIPEGMCNVLLESCATGRPVIATNLAGCKEIIEDQMNGYIIKTNDSNDLIAKIEQFLSLPYEEKVKMGIYGRNKVEKEFNRESVISEYLSEVSKIAD